MKKDTDWWWKDERIRHDRLVWRAAQGPCECNWSGLCGEQSCVCERKISWTSFLESFLKSRKTCVRDNGDGCRGWLSSEIVRRNMELNFNKSKKRLGPVVKGRQRRVKMFSHDSSLFQELMNDTFSAAFFSLPFWLMIKLISLIQLKISCM